MEKTVKQKMMESLAAFGRLYQLPTPPVDYFEALRKALHAYKWRLSEFNEVLNQLVYDEKYAETARFGKYPTINDFIRIRNRLKSKEFYTALSAYLEGAWWEKDTILAVATPQQRNALTLSGGLEKLYERTTADMPTPIYKIIDIVTTNESESPIEEIDTQHRIGKPMSMTQIISTMNKNQNNT